MKTICLSAGHSNSDPGAVFKDLGEAALTKQVTPLAAQYLRKHGIGVLEVPDTLSLPETIKWINDRKEQIQQCVELHFNSGGGTGVEGWYYNNDAESKKFTQFILDALMAETGLASRGAKDESTNRHGRLGFVHDTVPLACLIELAFIDGDYNFLKSQDGIKRLAKGVCRGILSYLGEQWKPELIDPKPAPKPEEPKPQPTPAPKPPTDTPVSREEFTLLAQAVADLQNKLRAVKEVI